MAPDQTPAADQWAALTCIMQDCRAELAVRWQLYAPLVLGELAPDADPLTPGDSVAGGWRVECLRGHVILVPGPVGAGEGQEGDCEAGLCADLHDHDEDLRTWRRSDVERLTALLRSAGVLPAAEPVKPAEPDPFDHVLMVDPYGAWAVEHPNGCRSVPCAVRAQAEIAAAVGDLPPRARHGRYQVGVNDLGDRLLIGDRIGGTDG